MDVTVSLDVQVTYSDVQEGSSQDRVKYLTPWQARSSQMGLSTLARHLVAKFSLSTLMVVHRRSTMQCW